MRDERVPGEDGGPGEVHSREEDRKSLLEMVEYIQREVGRAETLGVNLSEVSDLLAGARIMIESDELTDAAEIVGQCMHMASKRFSDHETLARSIKKAEADILNARNSGKDIAPACEHLKTAREFMDRGDYALGITEAKKAIDSLAATKDIAWGSGLALDQD